MSNIPKARSLLIDLLPALSGEHRAVVNDALALMFRESAVRKAPAQSVPVTDRVEALILMLLESNPTATFSDIAHWSNVNPGRVSEVANRWKQERSPSA